MTKQDYGTPRVFLDAVERRWGPIDLDLAASPHNAVCPVFIAEEDDSLAQDWHAFGGLLWLNPPFRQIKLWAHKCEREAMLGAHILFLVPASVGCHWFWDHCARFNVMPIAPRLIFDGTPVNPKTGKPDPFPKDLMLVEFGPHVKRAFDRWGWRK